VNLENVGADLQLLSSLTYLPVVPDFFVCHPGLVLSVIPDFLSVIPDFLSVIPDLIRDPLHAAGLCREL
jgi:hypothetical protein